MNVSWLAAAGCYDASQLRSIDADDLPLQVCAVLCRLLPSDSPDVSELRSHIARRLWRELQPTWLATADLASVCLLMDGLHAYDPARISGSDLAAIAKRLVAAEVTVGGPYFSADGKVDPFTNACVAQCLQWLAAPLPNVTAFLRTADPQIDLAEPEDWAVWLAMSAAASPLATQLRQYAGLLTSVLSLQILRGSEGYLMSVRPGNAGLTSAIENYCLRRLPGMAEPFGSNTRTMLQQVIRVDTNREISQLAWYVGSAHVKRPDISDKAYQYLGAANVHAWAAYTIYDDFLDDEGQPTMLGTANYGLRAMVDLYRTALPDERFMTFIEKSLAIVDQANTTETTYYRFSANGRTMTIGALPDFGQREMLADRALFHVLGPMAVLSMAGVAIGSHIWNQVMQAFRHYLISRQLNDDIHDWVKDLQAGQASYVVIELLRYLNVTPGTYSFDQFLPYARQQFWQHVLPAVCGTALEHIITAKDLMRDSLDLTPDNQLIGLFDYVESSLHAALALRTQSGDMLRALDF